MHFKAGKLSLQGSVLVADKRRGRILIERNGGSVHLRWFERDSSHAEDDLSLTPSETQASFIPECATGKVFVIQSPGTQSRLFFWIQEPDWEKYDHSFARKITDFIRESECAPSAQSKHSRSRPAGNSFRERLTFARLLGPGEVDAVLGSPQFCEKLYELMPPTLPKTRDELCSILRSPQFQQTLAFMDEALLTGDLNPLLLELGVDPSCVVAGGGVVALLAALKERSKKK